MATTVFESEELKLQDGTVVTARPLVIKRLRKFMGVIGKLNEIELNLDENGDPVVDENGVPVVDEDASEKQFDIMVEAVGIALAGPNPDLDTSKDYLEDVLDIPTINRILEVAGGMKMDPQVTPGVTGTA
jgi:hypothetical protein